MDQLSLDRLKIIIICFIQYFEDFMESQPQNPEFKNNPDNFHPCIIDCAVNVLLKFLPVWHLSAVRHK